MEGTKLFPDLKWAQQRDRVFITIEVPELTDTKISLKEKTLHLEGESNKKSYEADIEFFAEVVVDESKWNEKGRYLIMNISKKDKEAEEYWPRLTSEKIKNPHIKVDWSKWVDEEEEAPEPDEGGQWDPSQMQDFNMGDFGGDSDDEDEEEQPGEVRDPEPEEAKADLDDLDEDEEADATKKE